MMAKTSCTRCEHCGEPYHRRMWKQRFCTDACRRAYERKGSRYIKERKTVAAPVPTLAEIEQRKREIRERNTNSVTK